jgi:hypothetical protein
METVMISGQAVQIVKDFFTYTTGRLAVGAVGASSTVNLLIQADSNFEVQELTYFADQAAAVTTSGTRVVPNVSVLIVNTGSGMQLMNSAVALGSLFGTNENPMILRQPYTFQAQSVIAITITNFDAAVTNYNLSLNFIGQKIRRLG